MLEHEHLIRHGDGERAAAAAFADDGADDGGAQARHLKDVAPDGFGLAALLGVDAGVGAGGVNEGEDGQGEFFCQPHEAQRLAVALGARHAEVARGALACVAPLLVANDDARLALKAREAADDALVVGKVTVAVQLLKVGEAFADVVQGVGAVGVAREFGDLPRRELGVDVARELLALALEQGDFFADVDGVFALQLAQLVDAHFKLADGLLKVQEGALLVQGAAPGKGWARW